MSFFLSVFSSESVGQDSELTHFFSLSLFSERRDTNKRVRFARTYKTHPALSLSSPSLLLSFSTPTQPPLRSLLSVSKKTGISRRIKKIQRQKKIVSDGVVSTDRKKFRGAATGLR